MKVNQKHYRTIWQHPEDESVVQIIDQRHLPHRFVIADLVDVPAVATAIRDMYVRGAGLIGATAGFGMYLAALKTAKTAADDSEFMKSMRQAAQELKATRPTAVNLEWAVERQLRAMQAAGTLQEKVEIARAVARQIADEDAAACECIGQHGLPLLETISRQKNGQPVNILTHCNAGWLAFVDYGSATSPIYAAHDSGLNIHVWVDETRPRNQGARLTAWELGQHGVAHTVIADNTGGHLMQHGMVDIVITGADRVTATGDVANKIGTYLKALAARDNDIPFYVALPSSTFDWSKSNGLTEIPIEQRNADEVKIMAGMGEGGAIERVLVAPPDSPAANYAFDVTPARLVTGLITERGICEASVEGIRTLFPQHSGD